MSKAKQKELQLLKEEKEKKQNQFQIALKRLIQSEETLRINLDYSQQFFTRETNEALEEYSPIHISRLIFDKQLEAIKNQFQKMPNKQCRVQHFIVILLKVMKFPFEKAPLYMVGLKDMFYEIADMGKDTINYDNIFKYILGELVTLKEEEQNTQFQVQFQQKKKQDYLLHDNGIKRVLYSNDLKLFISLDQRQNTLKIYDQDMKNVSRFNPKKQMHMGRVPQIIDFDYSELTMRLAIIFADSTIQSIHLPNYLNKTEKQFEVTTLNQLIFKMPQKMRKIHYIQMLNKWLTISEQDNHVYLFDMEKVRLKPEQVLEKVAIDHNEMNISIMLQIVPLSLICFVAGNQIFFYNQNLNKKKYNKFSHHQIITIFKYSQEKNAFYLSGKQKTITIFSINRNHTFKITNFQINKVIIDFQVFPYFDTILICDDTNDVRLIHQPTKLTYQHHSFSNIVKMKDKFLQLYKLSKNEFIIFQTYMLIFGLQKIAIQKEQQFNFLPNYYYDPRKQQIYISVNHQIISFSVLFGQIRKSYSFDSSNIDKHQSFFMGNKTHIFIFDINKNIYQVYLKNQDIEGENRSYKKKVSILQVVTQFYDEEMRNLMIVGANCIHQVRNDFDNNFNTINIINFVNFSKISNAVFCHKTKYLTLITSNQLIYQIKNFQTHLSKCYKFSFPKSKNDHQDKLIVQIQYCPIFQILILLSNKNELAIIERLNISNHTVIDIGDYLSSKLKFINFSRFSYHLIKERNLQMPSVILYDDNGYVFDINLSRLFQSRYKNTLKEETTIKSFLKESYDIMSDKIIMEVLEFAAANKVKLSTSEFILMKVHDKPISIGLKLNLQILTTLTISKDGFIKLWNQAYSCLFVLKIPTLFKIIWNMKEIQNIKNHKSINEIVQIMKKHYTVKNQKLKPNEIVNKTKKMKQLPEPKKTKFEEAIPLDIESKEIEDLVLKEEDYKKNYNTFRGKPKMKYNPELTITDSHPWRHRREFVKIFERASPLNRISDKVPKDLLTLRNSLDMTERKKKQPNYKMAELILPQLKFYQNQLQTIEVKQKKEDRKDQIQNFESCLYVKTEKRRKKANELDEIDRQFFKKQMAMQNRRYIPRHRKQKNNSTIDVMEYLIAPIEQNRYDTMRDIQSVFESHNKECLQSKRGRIINIPKINVIKDYQ